MTEFLREVGKPLLFTVPYGSTFVFAAAALVLVAAVVRVSADSRKWLQTWLGITRRIEYGAITLLLISMIALSLLQIVQRNIFERGFVWVDPLLRHAVLWLGFMGAALATAFDRHIAIDVLSRLLSGRASHVVHALLRLFAAFVCLLLANATYGLMRDEYEFKSTSFLDLPTWVLMLVMPTLLIVMSYRFVLSAWRGRPPEPEIDPLDIPPTREQETA